MSTQIYRGKNLSLDIGREKPIGKNREDVVDGPSIVFTRKAVVDETFIRKSTNICQSVVRIDASQLYSCSMCQPMPTGLYTRWIPIQKAVDSHLDKTRTVALKTWSCLIFNKQDLIVKLRASTLQADKRKLTASVLMGFALIAILCLTQWVAFIIFVPVKSSAHLPLKKITNVAVGKENSMN